MTDLLLKRKEMFYMKLLKKIDSVITNILNIALIILIVIMVGMVVWQVIARYILKLSTPYAEELARLAIVWCVFIGSALAVRANEHIRVTVLVNKVPKKLRTLLFIIGSLSVIALSYVMVRYGMKHLILVWPDHQTTSLGYSRGLFYLPVPLMGILFFAYSLVDVIKYIKEMVSINGRKGDN